MKNPADVAQCVQDYFELKENDTDLDFYLFRTKESMSRIFDCLETLIFLADKYEDSDAKISIDRLMAKIEDLE